MQHQITTTNIVHYKVNTGLCLEAGMQTDQERMTLSVGSLENSLFRACTGEEKM
jgi:hypothetical protein